MFYPIVIFSLIMALCERGLRGSGSMRLKLTNAIIAIFIVIVTSFDVRQFWYVLKGHPVVELPKSSGVAYLWFAQIVGAIEILLNIVAFFVGFGLAHRKRYAGNVIRQLIPWLCLFATIGIVISASSKDAIVSFRRLMTYLAVCSVVLAAIFWPIYRFYGLETTKEFMDS